MKKMKKLMITIIVFLCSVCIWAEGLWHEDCDFGIHYDLHAMKFQSDLYEKFSHEYLKKHLEIIKPDWIQCDCKGHPGITSWPTTVGTMVPGLKVDGLKIHADVCHELGIKLGAHYSGVWDVEIAKTHPDWARVNEKSETEEWAVCLNSPYYEEVMIPQMLEVIDKYDVDGFWVDGDCWAAYPCYCEKCKKDFKLKSGFDVPLNKDDSHWNEWLEYFRELFVRRVNQYTNAIHDKKSDCLVISNWLLTYGTPVADNVNTDYISGDLAGTDGLRSAIVEGHFIPNRNRDWDLMAWGFQSDKGFWMHKTYEQLCQECGYVTACGGGVMIYDQPLTNGSITEYHSEMYGKIRDFIKPRAKISRHSKSIPQIAVMHNPKDYFKVWNEVPFRTGGDKVGYGISDMLLQNHYNFDFLMPYMIKGRMSDYKLVILNEEFDYDDEFKNELKNYIQKGGNVLMIGLNCADIFSDLLGVKKKEFFDHIVFVDCGEERTRLGQGIDIVESASAKNVDYLIWGEDGGVTESPICTINKYGKGQVMGIYCNMTSSYTDAPYKRNIQYFKKIFEKLNIDFMLYDVDAPKYVHTLLREKDGKIIVNLINLGSEEVASAVSPIRQVTEIPKVQNIKFKLKVSEKPNKVEILPCKKGLEWSYNKGVLSVTVHDLEIMESIVIEN